MRIAFLADAQSPNTRSFLTPLVEQGHDIYLLSLHHIQDPMEGVTTHFLSHSPLLPKPLYITRWPQVRRWLREINPDLVVAYRITGNGLLAALSNWHPLVVVPTGTDILGLEKRPPALRKIVRYVLRKADGILCWAPHMAHAALQLRGTRSLALSPSPWNEGVQELDPLLPSGSADSKTGTRLLLIQPRGVNREFFKARPYPNEEDGEVVLVTTRSLKRSYRHELMIRAMSFLKDTRPRLRLDLAGGGADGPRLWELARSLGVDNVNFLGSISHAEIPRILSKGSIYVSLIDHDGVSASLLEAMSVGLYPVVGDSDAARVWIREGWNGSLVGGDDPESIAQMIRKLAADISFRREVVERNWGLAEERADLARNSHRISEWFGEVVACHRRASNVGRKIA
ncbi:MAG: glycosyltransferase family 4 protein [Candidatus Eisenbacteria bacterium]|uniref:Glycosyltransferase family 4 protein n=1 Tax=Eiseniibacteriota bacterium TaxID=2212470 RepID=A0A948RZF0_UNCEI|nr:glycosyltransferase family 4 protein [Candidatus Eisenbacteria bacterium]MBU1950820.1 glycosyltransferase family 4 protein [Candidatus Eisenbacteria bacterium]MBU2692791.1 glycosyltransferase family 4 protein [Candidatus Eisenbacteria bacterium]